MSQASPKKLSLTKRLRRRFYVCDGKVFVVSKRGFKIIATPRGISVSEGLPEYQHVFVAVTPAWWIRSFFRAPTTIDALVVRNPFGRLGNQTFQLNHAITIAQHLETGEILAPGNTAIATGVFDLPDATRLVTSPNAIRWLTRKNAFAVVKGLLSPQAHLVGTFFHNSAFEADVVDQHTRTQSFALLRRLNKDSASHEPLDPLHLVIYMRGQDAFGPHRHKSYGQPPLSFYLTVLDHRNWKKVTIVSADRANPVIEVLENELKAREIPFSFQSGTLEEDLAVLSAARSLVSGRGTFIPAVSGMSPQIHTLYSFAEKDWMRNDITLLVVRDDTGDYWSQVCQDNWVDSPEQRRLMLEYSKDNLRLVEG